MTPYQRTETTTVNASPEELYDLVADVSRMGEWSPVCTGGSYDDDDRTWFTGTNALGNDYTWETRCRVDIAERGREFTFVNYGRTGNHEAVRWGFHFAPGADGTELTQQWEVLPGYADAFAEEDDPGMTLQDRLDLMKTFAESGMPETLENIKRTAEA
jgi:uncharacterized membrane protein